MLLKQIVKNENLELFLEFANKYSIFYFEKGENFATHEELWQLLTERKAPLRRRFGKITKVPKIEELTRRKKLIKTVLRQNRLNIEFTDEEILQNKTARHIEINNRIYCPNTKITKLLNKLVFNTPLAKNIIGKINKEDTSKDIFITSSPTAIIAASIAGKSCISPEGINEHMPFIHAASGYFAVAATNDFSWRAWVIIKDDKFSVLPGYPRENWGYQIAVAEYMKSLGYEPYKFEFYDNDTYYLDMPYFPDECRDIVQLEEENPFCVISGYRDPIDDLSDIFICNICERPFVAHEELQDGSCSYCSEGGF